MGGVVNIASGIVSSSDDVANNVLAVVTSLNVRTAVAAKLVNQLQGDSSSHTHLAFTQHHAQFVAAIENVIVDPTTQQIARADIIEMYNAVSLGSRAVINLRPLLTQFTQALHRVDPQINARPNGLKHVRAVIKAKKTPLHLVDHLVLVDVLLMVLGLVGATLATTYLVRGRRWQYWTIGLTFALPTLLLLALGAATSGIINNLNFKDANYKIIAIEAGKRLARDIDSVGYFYVVMTLAALGGWWLGRLWRRRRNDASGQAAL